MEHKEFAWQQPGYPTKQGLYWWRDGLLAVVDSARDDENWCCQVGYSATKTLCRYGWVREVLETGSSEALASEFARCWQQNPSDAARWIQEGKAKTEGRRPGYLADTEFTLEHPGFPTEHEIRWWRDGLLGMLRDEEEECRYCDENYGPARSICRRYNSMCDEVRNANPDVIATAFARCWLESQDDATDWTRLGKEREELTFEAYKLSKKRLIDAAPPEPDFNRDYAAEGANNVYSNAQSEMVPCPDDVPF